MEGRLEHDLKMQKTNQTKLAKMPEYVTEYYQSMKASRRTEATCRDYINKIHGFLSFINVDVINVKAIDINPNNVTKYLNTVDTKKDCNGNISYTSDSYKQTIWICLNGFLKFLELRGYIERNYLNEVAKPKINDQDRVNRKRVLLTDVEFNKILFEVASNPRPVDKKRDKAMMALMMCTGMRESALSEINIENLDLDNHKINGISKGKKETEYIFNDTTARAIKDWLSVRDSYVKENETDSLFLSNQGKRMAVNSIAKMVRKYTKQALGKELSPHKIRAGYCSIICNKTGNIEFARRAMGHASVNTTKLYYVTKGNEKAEAADMINI